MTTKPKADESTEVTPHVIEHVMAGPAVVEDAPVVAGPGRSVVVSPTGIRTAVDDAAVPALLTQGYVVE